MRVTSLYLDDELSTRLARLAHQEGRSEMEIVREAITTYQPKPASDRKFSLAAGFARIDSDAPSIGRCSQEELLEGFGEWVPTAP
jgi:predicted transcriptional regulator